MKGSIKILICYVAALLFLTNCKNSPVIKFDEISCNENYMPKYDPDGISGYEDENGVEILTPNGKLKKELKVFKPCQKYYYEAKYYAPSGKLISESEIRFVATGKRWEKHSLSQDEVVVQYANKDTNFTEFNQMQQIESYKLKELIKNNKVGIIENSEYIWFHQLFRNNQFKFTELAGPIHIDFPIEVNDNTRTRSYFRLARYMNSDSMSNSLFNNSVECTNTADEITTHHSRIGTLHDCWTFSSKSVSRLGDVNLKFKFQKENGFINFDYRGINGEKLTIELVKIE